MTVRFINDYITLPGFSHFPVLRDCKRFFLNQIAAMFAASIIVAIPVQNEEAHVGACLQALCRQTMGFDRLVLLLNNCTDTTAGICHQFKSQNHRIEIHEITLHGALASAGEARRLALELAAETGPDSIILTTDADTVPAVTWIEDNIREMQAGAEVVCGMAAISEETMQAIPEALREDDRKETLLLSLLDEMTCLLAPDRFDPWPRHQQQSGASIAVRCDVLQAAGGPPNVMTSEDRVLVERLRLVDARIRHAPHITVVVSGRLDGRAAGGMAETIKRRLICQDLLTDVKLEPAIDAYRRATAQARLMETRQGRNDGIVLARDLLVDPVMMRTILQAEFHGQAWAQLQSASPVLKRRRVAFADLSREIRIAMGLREKLLPQDAAMELRPLVSDA